jgi:hypothetical protein
MEATMKLRARALGLAIGTIWGLGVFVATLWSLQFGQGEFVWAISVYFLGHTRSIGGAFVGLLSGFVEGFVFGALIALVYNAYQKMLYKPDKNVA